MTAAAAPPVQRTTCGGVAVKVVEDHDDSREMIVLALEVFGAQVVSMNSAAEALASLQTVRPDVLVSDLSMPDMTD
jgi:CheY-like chemotaxis protein